MDSLSAELQGSPKRVLEDAEEGGSKHPRVRKSGKSVEMKWVLKDEQGSAPSIRRERGDREMERENSSGRGSWW